MTRSSWTFSSPPSGHDNNYIHIQDKNGLALGCLEERFGTDYHDLWLRVRPLGDSTTAESSLPGIAIRNVNGSTYGYAPESDAAGSILTTKNISKNENGYLKFGNGVIMQWFTGETRSGSTATQTTFSVSFSSTTSYKALAIPTEGDSNTGCVTIDSKGKGYAVFRYYSSSSQQRDIEGIAIGY